MPAMRDTGNRDAMPDSIDDAALDWFLRLEGGAADEAELARFEAWRTADLRHDEAYREVCALWADADALRPSFEMIEPDLPGETPPQLRKPAARGRGWWPVGPRQAIAAGLAFACLLLVVAVAPEIWLSLSADHRTATGEQADIVLPDGSRAHLNTDSAIAVRFSPDRRQIVLLRGEALFDVEKDAARPFEVMAAQGQATALGTVFAVRARDGGATVTVVEGHVRVGPQIQARGPVLHAGEQVRYEKGAAPGVVRTVDPAAVLAWRKGSLLIDDRPLPEALAEIDRYRPGRMILLGDRAAFEPVTARLSLDTLDGGLRALAATHGLTLTPVTDYLLILR